MIDYSLLAFFKIWILFVALIVVNISNPVYAILGLIFLFFNVAFLIFSIEFNFLAMALILVYIGAVAVLFLFVVMMLNIGFIERYAGDLYYMPYTNLVVFIPFIFIITFNRFNYFIGEMPRKPVDYLALLTSLSDSEVLGILMFNFEFGYFLLILALILLVAMIGPVILTGFKKVNIKRQNFFIQINETFKSRIKNVKINKEE